MDKADFIIFINGHPYDVRKHYAEKHKAPLPATPSMTVCEIAYIGGLAGARPTYRRDGSPVTDENNYCVVESDGRDVDWLGPVWTIVADCNRAVPLRHEMRFVAFPEGYY